MKKRPGPLAPPERKRPSLNTTALSYSCTTCNQQSITFQVNIDRITGYETHAICLSLPLLLAMTCNMHGAEEGVPLPPWHAIAYNKKEKGEGRRPWMKPERWGVFFSFGLIVMDGGKRREGRDPLFFLVCFPPYCTVQYSHVDYYARLG